MSCCFSPPLHEVSSSNIISLREIATGASPACHQRDAFAEHCEYLQVFVHVNSSRQTDRQTVIFITVAMAKPKQVRLLPPTTAIGERKEEWVVGDDRIECAVVV